MESIPILIYCVSFAFGGRSVVGRFFPVNCGRTFVLEKQVAWWKSIREQSVFELHTLYPYFKEDKLTAQVKMTPRF